MSLQEVQAGASWDKIAQTVINTAIRKVGTLSALVVSASTAVAGLIEIATDAEAQAKTATDKALVPSNLAALGASATFAGLTEHATDAEFVAQTATDKALVPSNLAARSKFSAHKNGTNQTSITSGASVKVTWSTELYDTGGLFASSTWTPSPGLALIDFGVTFSNASGVDGELLYLIVFKNGVAYQASPQARSTTGTQAIHASFQVPVDGNDTLEFYVQKNGAGDGTILGTMTDTWVSGVVV